MAMDGWGTIDTRWQELIDLDRMLGLLSRPVPAGDGLPAGLRDELRELGLRAGSSPRRKQLIERVWERKRPLLRQLGALDDQPLPPCA